MNVPEPIKVDSALFQGPIHSPTLFGTSSPSFAFRNFVASQKSLDGLRRMIVPLFRAFPMPLP